MKQYYCPHCQADLKKQRGFKPHGAYWTCTECGQFLVDPADYDSDSRFDGVAWFCDNCNAHLNRQRGFSDSYSTWKCKKCGYVNQISEDEIDYSHNYSNSIEEDDDYESEYSEESSSYSSSYSYDSDEGSEDDDSDSDGYSWDEEDDDSYDEDDDDDDEDDDNDSYDNDDADDWNNDSEDNYSPGSYSDFVVETRSKIRAIRNTVLGILVLVLCIYGLKCLNSYYLMKKAEYLSTKTTVDKYKIYIPVGISSEGMTEYYHLPLEKKLIDAGFTDVSSEPVYDLEYKDREKEGKVKEVIIEGEDTYPETIAFPPESRIRIKYHMVKVVNIPVSSRKVKKFSYLLHT